MARTLVAYMSFSGNTKKVAEAIYGEISGDKEIKPINEVADIKACDISFLGFPTHGYGPDKKAKAALERLCKDGKKVALFVTHAAPEDEPEVSECIAKFREAASGAELVGVFHCQGELAKGVKFIMKISPSRKLRSDAKRDTSKGRPDEVRLDRARAFARDAVGHMA